MMYTLCDAKHNPKNTIQVHVENVIHVLASKTGMDCVNANSVNLIVKFSEDCETQILELENYKKELYQNNGKKTIRI